MNPGLSVLKTYSQKKETIFKYLHDRLCDSVVW